MFVHCLYWKLFSSSSISLLSCTSSQGWHQNAVQQSPQVLPRMRYRLRTSLRVPIYKETRTGQIDTLMNKAEPRWSDG